MVVRAKRDERQNAPKVVNLVFRYWRLRTPVPTLVWYAMLDQASNPNAHEEGHHIADILTYTQFTFVITSNRPSDI
jgi:hypothetical protein